MGEYLPLPDNLVTKKQLRSLTDEVEKILDQAVQGRIRKEKTGTKFAVSKPSSMLQAVLDSQKKDLTVDNLWDIAKVLSRLEQESVVVRVVLSTEPTPQITARIVQWFRSLSDRPVLLRFGIQPAIAGGCLVYTENHRYDFTLRTKLKKSNVSLAAKIAGIPK